MLAEMEPSELIEWRAAKEANPPEDRFKPAGTIAATFHNEMERYCAGKAGKSRVDESRLHGPDKYIPRIQPKQRQQIKVNQTSIDITQRIIESAFIGK